MRIIDKEIQNSSAPATGLIIHPVLMDKLLKEVKHLPLLQQDLVKPSDNHQPGYIYNGDIPIYVSSDNLKHDQVIVL